MTGPRRPRAAVAAASAIVVATSLAVAAATAGAASPPTAVPVELAGRTSLAQVVSPIVLLDRGTVRGSPVGSGRITLVYRLRPRQALAITRFRIVTPRGTVTGRARSTYTVDRVALTFTGVGVIAGGTGAYRGIRSGPLRFDAVHSITGKREAIAFTGRATTPAGGGTPR